MHKFTNQLESPASLQAELEDAGPSQMPQNSYYEERRRLFIEARQLNMEDAVYYGEDSVGRPLRRSRDNADDDSDDADGNCCTRCCKWCCACFRARLLTILIFVATGAGIGVGVVLRFVPPFDQPKLHPRIMSYLFFFSELMIRFMTFIIVPFIVASLISSMGAMQSSTGLITLRLMTYYIGTSILAVGEGLGIMYAIRPGLRGPTMDIIKDQEHDKPEDRDKILAVMDMFRNLVPDNMIKSSFEMASSSITFKNVTVLNETLEVEVPVLGTVPHVNILGITFFSMVFGAALAKAGPKARVTFMFFDGLYETMLAIIHGMLWVYPIGTFLIMMYTVISLEDPVGQIMGLFIFIVTVLLGLFAHACIVLPILFVIFTRRNPFKHVYWCFRAIITGFATNNSSATLPVTMDCLEQSGIDRRIVRLVCPVGSLINMDGLALYEAMACVFIATLRGTDLTPVQIVVMACVAVAVSIGSQPMGGGIVSFIIIFTTVGLPLQDIFILLPFDWMLARFRTMVNVWGDCVGTAIVDKCSQSDLAKMAAQQADDNHSLDTGPHDGAVLTSYVPRQPRDWTVRLVNERGDKLCVSKV